MTRLGPIFILVFALALFAGPLHAEVLHGTATIWFDSSCGQYWYGSAIDVGTLTTVGYFALEADLALAEPVNYCGILHLWFSNGGHGAVVGGTLEELETAPEPHSQWVMGMPLLNEACVLKTVEVLYVKFAVRALRNPPNGTKEADVEYYVQTDGTPEFGPALPVATKTWGQIKALYR